jgi:uroporphyrinogen decarboxylase
MISPAMFRMFMLTAYKKMTTFLKDRGVGVIIVDTDGDCWELIPLFLEGGVTGLYPFEVAAGMNVAEVRQAFPKLQILGGIDKMKIAAGPPAIDEELESKVPFLLRSGGYVAYADHNVPPDVTWENLVYYRRRLEAIIRETASS